MVAELMLDLDMTWHRGREIFAHAVFEHAERRYGSAHRIQRSRRACR